MGRGKQPLRTEFKGFKVGDKVRLIAAGIPKDYTATVSSVNHRGEFKLNVRTKEGSAGTWGPIWFDEMEKV